MKTYERGGLSKEILKAFLVVGAVGGVVVMCATFPGMAYIFELFNARTSQDRARLKRAVKRMERDKILMRRIKNGREEIVVTRPGKQLLKKYVMDDLYIKPLKKWDKRWRVLMFDIPEKQKKIRDDLSFTLKNMGMHSIQNSVFISPYPCKDEIDFITNFYSAEKYFIYFETGSIECVEDLLTHFRLK